VRSGSGASLHTPQPPTLIGLELLSPSALTRYLGCAHAATLARELRGSSEQFAVSEYEQLIRDKGDAHEQAYLAELQQRAEVATIERDASRAVMAERTRAAMVAGAEAIFQATFVHERWRGHADFLERIEGETTLGGYGYEAVDTKLARNEARPSHVLQLCFYSECIEQIQGVAPAHMHLQLGSGRRESLRPRDFDAYFARAKRSLERFADEQPATIPYPCAACPQCDFRAHCEREWRARDDLSYVAGIRHSQAVSLEQEGVDTLAALGDAAAIAHVLSVPASALGGLHEQAALQVTTRATGSIATLQRPAEQGRGFALLPQPSRLDMAIDLEGDPFWRADRELTFMFGLLERAGEAWTYSADWAHDELEEARLAGRVIDAIHARLRDDPGLHVYHYGAVEVSVLKRICMQNATHEEQLDNLLRRHVFVDVVQAVKQSTRIGLEGYGLKAVERLPGFVRTADVGKGADAVLEYERWLADGSGVHLEAIERYNDEDCRSTVAVADWLRGTAPPDTAWLAPILVPIDDADEREPSARDLLRLELVGGEEPGSERWLAGELLAYHRRAAKPQWWAHFARMEMTTEELHDEAESLAGLLPDPTRVPYPVKGTLAYPMTFPPQEHKVGPGSYVDAETAKAVNVERLDEEDGVVWIARRATRDDPFPRAIVPGTPLPMGGHEAALERLAVSLRDRTAEFPALEGLLRNDLPVVAGRAPGSAIQTSDLQELRGLALGLTSSSLVIQGPPGTGKTYTGARLVTELVRAGKHVGITAFSHKAIDNLCREIETAACEEGLLFDGTRHGKPHLHDGTCIKRADAAPYPASVVVASTSWLFAKGDHHFDYLVIDEAGQFALADALACGTSADNLILLGDPSQLSQVVQGTHPPGTAASALGHVLGEHQTIPPDRGVFLDTSWRMHPEICSFISGEFYDDRLRSHRCCGERSTSAGSGLRMLEVEHVGNASRSREEASAIGDRIAELLRETRTDEHGVTRPIVPDDIMVVTPYNAQVRTLRSELPDGVRIGTVDKFQGQEAPIVFFSMASSSGEDAPRAAGFLFSRNRLNVAISRAQSLAYLVCSPRLLDARATNVEDMRLVNSLCRLAEVARVELSLR
jgi:predicted RecB family nuclease